MIDKWGRERFEFVQDPIDFFDLMGQAAWHRELQMTCLHTASIREMDDVVDMACGAGWLGLYLAHRVNTVYFVDKDERMVERARRNAIKYKIDNVAFQVADASHLPYPDYRFSVIFCVNLLFLLDDPLKAIREMMRTLKPGGRLIMVNPSRNMNLWAAEQYCMNNGITQLDKDMFVSWAATAARCNPLMIRSLENPQIPEAELIKQHYMLGGLASFVRVVKRKELPTA
ncbi:class I SAM-dependent methyltransferase [Alicyclobacillus tolerans]|uniref:Methyltransferase domain-containing protein n=2 Tax=Alicyclobacillus tolerans TaxID=90970 RepID=A0A1M6WD70_9BACL|nr:MULTISPECIES: class I SAM-dependent methyltransferase [Alicyclobacillus]MDP9727987.1 ubiquinone/menaquinone biosynthesis C-methylase UbiE [Alicyclobacillus tengchongensis]SHK91651.1 Methyltransferase domain-containing protein [Alicyclobacillus montanus]